MEEMWINEHQDWTEFLSYLRDEKIVPNVTGKDSEGNFLVKAGNFIVHVPNSFELPKQEQKFDPLIFGKDSTLNVVNITVDNEQVFIYFADGTCSKEEYYNWAVGCDYHDGAVRLKGNQYFKYMKDLTEDQYYHLKEAWNPRIWLPRTASEGFMLKSGMTYYKGMKVSDVSLLSFDIEATTLDPNSPDAVIPLMSTTFRGKDGKIEKRIFDMFDYHNTGLMFFEINEYIKKLNPDVVLGHNILGYDLPYLNKNSANHGLAWGRDGSKMIFDEKPSKMRKDGSQQYEYFNGFINGREIIDTFFLSIKYDLGREFPSYGLKAIEKHLGFVKEDRSWDFTNWPVSKLIEDRKAGNTEMWNKFKQYCADDSDSPIKMWDLMIPAFFYLTQSVPKTLQQIINEASGSQLDALMIRSYLQTGHSLPKSSQKVEFEGAISMGIPGVHNNVRKVDVASLYPSIMLQYDIYDNKKDPERNMLKMLEYFRDERLNNKRLAKETGDRYYDDMQNAQKIMINSMYGFMGAGYLLFNYPAGAAEVTKHGREILLKGVEWSTGRTLNKVVKAIRNEGTEDAQERFEWILGDEVGGGKGYTLVNVDTDSFSYTDGTAPTKEKFTAEIAELNSLYESLIKWENDGVYEKIIVVKAKNYVLVKDGKTKYKGSSLTDQKKEPRLLQLLEEFLQILLSNKSKEEQQILLEQTYNLACREVVDDFKVDEWVTKKTVTKAVLNPVRKNEQGPKDAIDEAIANDVISGVQEGDKIYLYSAIDGEVQKTDKNGPVFAKKSGQAKMIENRVYRFKELWNNDEDTWHYISRVRATLEILENVIDTEKFVKYHNVKNRKLLVNE